MNLLFNNLCILDLNSCQKEFILFETLSDFLKKEVMSGVILVKEKVTKIWLARFLGNEIVDLFEERRPSLHELKTNIITT